MGNIMEATIRDAKRQPLIWAFPSPERVRWLEEEVERLTDRNELLEMELGATRFLMPPALKLSPKEGMLLSLLLARSQVTKAMAMTSLYSDDDEPGLQILDVFICAIRARLRPYSIEITTIWGRGWFIEPGMKSKLRALIAALAEPSP
jgi:two-component system cell cycle response regulator CtrA